MSLGERKISRRGSRSKTVVRVRFPRTGGRSRTNGRERNSGRRTRRPCQGNRSYTYLFFGFHVAEAFLIFHARLRSLSLSLSRGWPITTGFPSVTISSVFATQHIRPLPLVDPFLPLYPWPLPIRASSHFHSLLPRFASPGQGEEGRAVLRIVRPRREHIRVRFQNDRWFVSINDDDSSR